MKANGGAEGEDSGLAAGQHHGRKGLGREAQAAMQSIISRAAALWWIFVSTFSEAGRSVDTQIGQVATEHRPSAHPSPGSFHCMVEKNQRRMISPPKQLFDSPTS